MADNFVQVPPNSTGLKIDTSELTVSANTVERQNICIADSTTAANIAKVNSIGELAVADSILEGCINNSIVSVSDSALEGGLLIAQGVASLAPSGPVLMGWTATSNPTETSGEINPISLTTAGAVRVDGSGVTQPVSGTFFQTTQPVSLANAPTTPVTGTFWQTTQPVSGTVTVIQSPVTTPGSALIPKFIAATTAVNLKASAGNLYGLYLLNLAATTSTTVAPAVMYVQFYDTTTVVSLSTTNFKFSLPIPPANGGAVGGGQTPLDIPPGVFALANFTSGISIVINATSASNTTASGTAPVGVIWID